MTSCSFGFLLLLSAAPLGSSGSFGFVEFIRTRPGSSRVYLCSLGSFGRGPAKGVLWFIRVRWVWSLVSFDVLWVHSGATWGSSGSFRFVGFIRARPGGRCVRSGSLGSFMHGLGDIGFIGFVWFTLAHLMGRRVHLGSVGLFWRADSVVGPFSGLDVVGFNWVSWVHSCSLSGSLGSFGCDLGVVGFVQALPGCRCIHFGASWGSSGSFGFVGFFRARQCGRWVHSGLLGSFGRALGVSFWLDLGVVRFIGAHSGVVVFIRVIWVHSSAPWMSSGSLGSVLGVVGFTSVQCVRSGTS